MPLKKYHAKRNFEKTPEPHGSRGKKAKSRSLIFVIQKHAASHLHYDLRLEMHGVLISWAVPKGPPLQPGEKHLAIQVEDHPFEYKDFEGVIPKGNYGAGKVIIWDKGTYESADNSIEDPNLYFSQALDKGHIVFILQGKKLSGEFALIRTKRGQKNNWLFIKTQNNTPHKKLKITDKSVVSGLTLEQIHDDSLQQEHFDLLATPKKPMPNTLSVMLATAVTQPIDQPGWLHEIKWDGYRIVAFLNQKQVKLHTRNHQDYTHHFATVATELAKLKLKAVFDGEMVVVDDTGRSRFQLMQKYQSEGVGHLIYYIFDVIWFNGYDLRQIPLIQRKLILSKILPKLEYVRLSEHVMENGTQFFKAAKTLHLEGIMAKKANSVYSEGKRTRSWLKIKSRPQQEAVICGYTAPRGSRKLLGALILGVYERGHLQYIGHTGTGFTEKIIKELKPRLDRLAQEQSPFERIPKTNSPVTWVKPQLVCEVAFHEWTAEGLLRQPAFLGLRTDKLARSVHRELPIPTVKLMPAQKYPSKQDTQSSKLTKSKSLTNRSSKEKLQSKSTFLSQNNEVIMKVNRHPLKLTHLNKVYWPKSGYTKRDLIEYYHSVAKFILPYLKNRLQVLHRFPEGVDEPGFYQKNIVHVPSWLHTVPIHSEGEQRKVHYLLCENEASLLYMVNLGCIDMNPWLSKYTSLAKPDFCVLDLDPYGIDFEAVVEVAHSIHKFLEHLKVNHYCKTSGATGLHIFIPLKGKYTFEHSRQFAELIFSYIHEKIPDITSLERMPKRRKGKVYLDFLQNRIGQTIAAPYSVRPRPDATVSTPLQWRELKPGLSPQQFTMETIHKRLAKEGDIWLPILKSGVNIKEVLKNLEG